jgi:hypothetical protein
MTRRSTSGENRNVEQPRPSRDEAARGIDPQTEPNEIEGLDLTTTTRSGEDERKKGWYWHWNFTVDQLSPLIGLKGVGLLNSYTVWTDRRDKSPHRGFAFPSQQSEADFYGEDRAELITINKILGALDLIEIRKVMIARPDEQGRNYRVPHNFYRVKDMGDNYRLTVKDALKVAELAEANPAIYRYVRRVFSQRFAPIGPNNVWVDLIVELRKHELWRRLEEKTAKEEERATARTKAGHASRKGLLDASGARDAAALAPAGNDSGAVTTDGPESGSKTSVAIINKGLATDVGASNEGSDASVASSNDGFAESEPTIVAPLNTANPTRVAPTNRMYNQSTLTTTTTSSTGEVLQANDVSRTAVTGENRAVTDELRPAPGDGPAQQRAIVAFQDANGRVASAAERTLLARIAERYDEAALRQSPLESGWSWIAAAVYEAVEAGSAFVAPRRVREILTRWEREGAPPALTGSGVRPALIESVRPDPVAVEPEFQPTPDAPVDAPFLVEECGMPSGAVWAAVLDEIVANHRVSRADRDAWLRATRLAGRGPNGELIVIAPNAAAQRRIASRLISPLRAAAAAVIGRQLEIELRSAAPLGLRAPDRDARAG